MNTSQLGYDAPVYSVAVRFSAFPGEETRGAYVLLLVDETNEGLVDYQLSPEPPSAVDVRDWVLLHLNSSGADVDRPWQLMGDDPTLMQALRFGLRPLGIEAACVDRLPALDAALGSLEVLEEGPSGLSLARVDDDEDDEVPELLLRWGTDSRQATELAEFLVDNFYPGEGEMEVFEAIGRHYLSQTREVEVQRPYFEVSARTAWERLKLRPALRSVFDSMWVQLSQTVTPEENAAFLQAAVPLLRQVAQALADGRNPEENLDGDELVQLSAQLQANPNLGATLQALGLQSPAESRLVVGRAADELLRLLHIASIERPTRPL